MSPRLVAVAVLVLLALPGCSLDRTGIGSELDGGARDASRDAGPPDASDAEPLDAGIEDAGIEDAGIEDAGIDSGTDDGGVDSGLDSGVPDGGVDAGIDSGIDAGVDSGIDSGMPDAGCSFAPFCMGSELYVCTSGAPVVTPCELGCGGSPAACRVVVPSNVGTVVSFADGTASLAVPNGEIWQVDSDDGSIDAYNPTTMVTRAVRAPGTGTISGIRYERAMPSGSGGGYGIFAVDEIRIAPNGGIVGLSGRARSLVFVAAGDVVVEGFVSVRGDGNGPGPGGGAGGAVIDGDGGDGGGGGGGGGGEASGLSNADGGGGGGGFGSAGAAGGSPSAFTSGGGGGAAFGVPSLSPLRGGSGGGAGADNDGGRGGHGGGGLQISSASTILITGVVEAGGEGGRGGFAAPGRDDTGGGGGGGSGGGILLEAIAVNVSGRVAAMGGAGGQGARCDDCAGSGTNGSTYDPATSPPATGSATMGGGGGGGAGSSAAGVAAGGGAAENGGGGGGGAGRIRIHTAAGTETYGGTLVFPTTASGLTTVGAVGRTP